MKRWIVGLLAAAMVCLVQIPGVAAAEETYTMGVLVNGSTSSQVEQGETVEVSLTMTKQGASKFDLYCMQDYVCFDPDYFAYVEDSLEVYTVGGDWKTPVFRASAVSVPAGEEKPNRIFVNRASDTAQTLSSGVTVLSFQLKAVKTGTTQLTNGVMEVFRDPYQLHSVSGESAAVEIVKAGSGETTPAPTHTPAPEATSRPQQTPAPQPSQNPNGESSSSVGSSSSSSSSSQNHSGEVLSQDEEQTQQGGTALEEHQQPEPDRTDAGAPSPAPSQHLEEQESEETPDSHVAVTVLVVLVVLAIVAGSVCFVSRYHRQKR